ncbi:MAG: phosphatidate cytidylyltransferase [Pseudomonadota bacterium]|jgi:phosphatidate cytidylyltransferase
MTRILSAVILGSFVIYIIAAAPAVLGAVVILAAVLIAAHEMYALLKTAGVPLSRVPALAATVLTAAGAMAGGPAGLAAAFTAGFTLIFAGLILSGNIEGSVVRLSGGALLVLYPVWSLSHLTLYLQSDAGRRALLFLLICVWICDSAAYYAGSTLGRRKLAPDISPNKTIEGAAAGVLGAVAGAFLLNLFHLVTWSVTFSLAAGLFISILAQFGDLAESMIKRDAGVKDSGSIIPGHGGVLDRVDALLFSVPLFYYVLFIPGGFM